MRARRFSLLIGCLLMLAACGKKTPTLPAEEVLKRSIIRSHTTESVSVSVSGSFDVKGADEFSGSGVMQGAIIRGGRAWSADTSFELNRLHSFSREGATGHVIAVSPGDGVTYYQFPSLEGALLSPMKKALAGGGTWWKNGQPEPAPNSVTPDPLFLGQFSDVLEPTGDAVIEKTDDGDVYHVTVHIKPEALGSIAQAAVAKDFSATGDLWIDAATFDLHRARWHLTGVPTAKGILSFDLDATLAGYGIPHPVNPPTGSASTLPLDAIFATFSL